MFPKRAPRLRGSCLAGRRGLTVNHYLGVELLLLVVSVPALPGPDDFKFAPVVVDDLAPAVVDELVEVEAGCLVCLYIFADAANGEAASPAITSAAIVNLLLIVTKNSSDGTSYR